MYFHPWKRREVITLLGGAAAAWPLAAQAQQAERVRRVGVLMSNVEGDVEQQARMAAFRDALGKGGWTEGRNLRLDVRFGAVDMLNARAFAIELANLAPEVVLAANQPLLEAMRLVSNVPVVFLGVSDPAEQKLVESLARPGGQITGFTPGEFATGAKWVELLTSIAPGVRRVTVIMTVTNASNAGHFRAIEQAAATFGIAVARTDVRSADSIMQSIDDAARHPDAGLIVTANPVTGVHRAELIARVSGPRLPAVYPFRYFVTSGGLLSYGADTLDLYRQAATYVGRILQGARAGDLPVQQPTKFELVINLKTARALGMEIPPMLLARADEVIE